MKYRLALVALAVFHALLLAESALLHSPTVDEGGHILSGLIFWKTGRFSTYIVNPPLAKLWLSFPVATLDVEVPFRSDLRYVHDWDILHDQFLANNRTQYVHFIQVARLAQIPLSILGFLVIAAWSRDCYGRLPSLIATALWATNPGIIGWGSIANVDLPCCVMAVITMYATMKWLKECTFTSAAALGILLGLAQLTKFTLLALYPCIILLAYLATFLQRPRSTRSRDHVRTTLNLSFIIGLSIAVVNCGYAGDRVGSRLGDLDLHSTALRQLQSAAPWVHLPLPDAYFLGLDEQKFHVDSGGYPAYFRGTWHDSGFAYYYAYALLIKEPLPFLILIVIALGSLLCRPSTAVELRLNEAALLLSAAALFAAVSSQTGLNAHYRYAIAAIPFLVVLASRIAAHPPMGRSAGFRSLGLLCMCWSCICAVSIRPNYIGYFNGLVGGHRNGPAHLAESNVDWGQDLFLLRAWLSENNTAGPVGLAYFGPVGPEIAGIDYCFPSSELAIPCQGLSRVCPQCSRPPAYIVISANLLCGKSSAVATPEGWRLLPQDALSSWRYRARHTILGDSLHVFAADLARRPQE